MEKQGEKEKIYIYRGFIPWRSQIYVPKKEAEYIMVVSIIGRVCAKSSFQTHGTKTKAIKEAINHVVEKGPIKDRKIIFLPIEDSHTVYADGYFGRPLVPSCYWIIKKLSRRQIEFAKKYIAFLSKKES